MHLQIPARSRMARSLSMRPPRGIIASVTSSIAKSYGVIAATPPWLRRSNAVHVQCCRRPAVDSIRHITACLLDASGLRAFAVAGKSVALIRQRTQHSRHRLQPVPCDQGNDESRPVPCSLSDLGMSSRMFCGLRNL